MATWKYTDISINGRLVKAQAPIIVSASRSTDIPAFYTDWFSSGLKLVIRHGLTHLMALNPTFPMTRHVSSCFGLKIQDHSLITLTFLKSVILSATYNIPLMIMRRKIWRKFHL